MPFADYTAAHWLGMHVVDIDDPNKGTFDPATGHRCPTLRQGRKRITWKQVPDGRLHEIFVIFMSIK
jgi:hypothetical protein